MALLVKDREVIKGHNYPVTPVTAELMLQVINVES